MRAWATLPPAFARYRAVRGMLDFGIFDEAAGDEDSIVAAIAETLATDDPAAWFDGAMLRNLGSRLTDRGGMLGTWYDPATQQLRKVGEWETADGTVLVDPSLAVLEEVRVAFGRHGTQQPGAGGELAFAFVEPPYQLLARPAEIQQLFDSIMDVILPAGAEAGIRDWASPDMLQVSNYFEAGMEWWGVYLFSIYLPGSRQLTVIAGSTSDQHDEPAGANQNGY